MLSEYNKHCAQQNIDMNTFPPNPRLFEYAKRSVRVPMTYKQEVNYFEAIDVKPSVLMINEHLFATEYNPINVYDMRRQRMINQILVDGPPTSVTRFSQPPTRLLVVSPTKSPSEHILTIVDALDTSGEYIKQLKILHAGKNVVAFGSKYVFLMSGSSTCVYDVLEEKIVVNFESFSFSHQYMALLGNSKVCLCTMDNSQPSSLVIYSMETGELLKEIPALGLCEVTNVNDHHFVYVIGSSRNYYFNTTTSQPDGTKYILYNHTTMTQIRVIQSAALTDNPISIGSYKMLLVHTQTGTIGNRNWTSTGGQPYYTTIEMLDMQTEEIITVYEGGHDLSVLALDRNRTTICIREPREERSFSPEHQLLDKQRKELSTLLFFDIRSRNTEQVQVKLWYLYNTKIFVDLIIKHV